MCERVPVFEGHDLLAAGGRVADCDRGVTWAQALEHGGGGATSAQSLAALALLHDARYQYHQWQRNDRESWREGRQSGHRPHQDRWGSSR